MSAAEAEVLRQRQETLAQVAQAYWAVYYQQRLVEIAQQAMHVSAEEQRVVRLKVEQGTLAPVEETRANTAVVQANKAMIDARQALQLAEDTLSLALASAGHHPRVTTAPAKPVRVDIDVQVVEAALLNNPGLVALRIQETNATTELNNARHQRLPELNANGRPP